MPYRSRITGKTGCRIQKDEGCNDAGRPARLLPGIENDEGTKKDSPAGSGYSRKEAQDGASGKRNEERRLVNRALRKPCWLP
jgi:hypothetical protein